MAFPTYAVVNTGTAAIYNLAAGNKLHQNGRKIVEKLNELYNLLKSVYTTPAVVVAADGADATLVAYCSVTGSLGLKLGREAIVGDIFEVDGNHEPTANELSTAKGSAVANHDAFIVSAAGASAAVVYLGLSTSPLTLASKATSDFVSIGS